MWAHRLEETDEEEGQVVAASCNRSRAESRRLATGSGGSQSVRGRVKDRRSYPRHQGAPGFRRSSGAQLRIIELKEK